MRVFSNILHSEYLRPASFFRSQIGLLLTLMISLSAILVFSIAAQQASPAKASAGDGASSNIRLLDPNANGKIDRITFDVANPNTENWALTGEGAFGFSVTQLGNDINISSVSITSAPNANPVQVQIDLDEVDADLVVNSSGTSSGAVELIYTQGNAGTNCTTESCLTDDTDEELNAIASGDTGATDTESDFAAPIALSSVFRDNNTDGQIDQVDVVWSESIGVESFSAPDLVLGNAGSLIWGTPTNWGTEGPNLNITVLGPVNITGDASIPTFSYDADGTSNLFGTSGGTAVDQGPINIGDAAKPQIKLVSPSHNSTVNLLDPFTVFFTEPINTGTFTFTDSDVGSGDYNAPVWTVGNTRVDLTHNTNWTDMSTVNIQITVASDPATNTLGTNFANNPFTYSTDSTSGGGGGGGGGSTYNRLKTQETQQQQADTTSDDTTTDDQTADDTSMTDEGTTQTTEEQQKQEREMLMDTFTKNDPAPEAPLPPEVAAGMLVKIEGDSAVYFIDSDNRRHAFPTSIIYNSWFADFSNVVTVSPQVLASIPLGSNVLMRPGTWMIKIVSSNRVYAVEPFGIIRWVQTEADALALFGPNWNKRIVDVSDVFFTNYAEGDPLTALAHPSGSVIQYEGETAMYYINGENKHLITPAVFVANFFRDAFVIKGVPMTFAYAPAVDLPEFKVDIIMTLR